MRSAKELVAGLREIVAELDEPDTNDGHDIPGGYVPHPWSRLIYEAADYIERTAAPADGLPEFETTADLRELMREWTGNRLAASRDTYEKGVEKLLRDLDKAIAFAAFATMRADDTAAFAATLQKQFDAAIEQRDREAAARHRAEAHLAQVVPPGSVWVAKETHDELERDFEQAEAREATLRAALELIADRRLSDPLEFREIARAALATTSTVEGGAP